MSHTQKLLAERNLKPEDIHLPAGGIAIFGRTGTGKSSIFYGSEFLGSMIVADTGSLAHNLYAKCPVVVVDQSKDVSPIQQVTAAVLDAEKRGALWALDSFSTLQEVEVAWWKRGSRNQRGPAVNLKDHQTIVGNLRDLALLLARGQGFTIFNTTPGGRGKTPDGNEVTYPAGAITGYPSLNGTNPNSETILARWGTVWGVFQGHKATPRGLYVPGSDIRPESHSNYSPLKDPTMVLRDTKTAAGEGEPMPIHAVPDMRLPENAGRCWIDEILIEIAARFPKRRPAAAPAKHEPSAAPEPAKSQPQGGKK